MYKRNADTCWLMNASIDDGFPGGSKKDGKGIASSADVAYVGISPAELHGHEYMHLLT